MRACGTVPDIARGAHDLVAASLPATPKRYAKVGAKRIPAPTGRGYSGQAITARYFLPRTTCSRFAMRNVRAAHPLSQSFSVAGRAAATGKER